MSLINTSFFVGNLQIPNATESSVASVIVFYINKFEPEFLQNLLGYPLYKEFIANPSADRFKNIINGCEFTDFQGYTAKWKGLIEVLVPDPTPPSTTPIGQKQSIIANYVYFRYRQRNETQFTGIGEVKMKASEGSESVSPRKKMAFIWNEIHYNVKVLMQFFEMNQATYPEWTTNDEMKALRFFGFANPIF